MASRVAPTGSEVAGMLFRSSDLVEVETFVTQAVTPHRMHIKRPRERFTTEIDHRRSRFASVNRLAYGTDVSVTAEFDDFYVLVVPLAGRGDFSCAGRIAALDATRGALVSPRHEFHTSTDAGFVKLVTRLNLADVREAARVHDVALPAALEPVVTLNDPATPVVEMVAQLFAASGERESPLEAVVLYSALIRGLLAPHRTPSRERPKASARVVARAESYIESAALEPLTVESIALATSVSPRVLQHSFRVHRSSTPMLYLRNVRLDRAYRALRTRDARAITDIALDCGFSHFGRFSGAYKARFGELPSQTKVS